MKEKAGIKMLLAALCVLLAGCGPIAFTDATPVQLPVQTQSASGTSATATTTTTTTTTQAPQPSTTEPEEPTEELEKEEIRAVWLSFYELSLPEGGRGKKAFRAKYEALFRQLEAFGLNTVFVHVRAYSDAVYPTALAPWAASLTGKQGRDPGFDPLEVLCGLAKKHRLNLHAWLNPFRVTQGKDLTKLSPDNPALAHIKNNDGWVNLAGGSYYWNPAVPEVHALVYDAVRELMRGYPLAGAHIDDYFYPLGGDAFDAAQYEAYTGAGGALSLGDWRRELMNSFVGGLYRAVKRENPAAAVSLSPRGSLTQDKEELYADAALWLREPGYTDWMVPQIYFGFEHPTLPFRRTAEEWAALPRHGGAKLVAGLGMYKAGAEDAYAGAAKAEWQQNSDIIARQAQYIQSAREWDGFSIYSMTSLCGGAKEEAENLRRILGP